MRAMAQGPAGFMRGFDALPILLAAGVAALWCAEELATGMTFRGSTPVTTVLLDALSTQPAFFAVVLLAFMPLLLFVTVVLNVAANWTARQRIPALALAVVAGAVLFSTVVQPALCLAIHDERAAAGSCAFFSPHWLRLAHFARAAIWGGLIATALYAHRREVAASRMRHEAQLQAVEAGRQETEARLGSLQAQMEPHFLFNTLAHIQRFRSVDAPQGRLMLGALIAYMESALPQMRTRETTLGQEIALVQAYGSVQQLRMGERLRLLIDVPEDLAGARVPTMAVLTLAENAVKHGLGPKREGGTLQVRARAVGGRLEIAVSDDGVGLRATSGTGRGLANTRSRLATLHGASARLEITSVAQGGVHAVMYLPLEPVGSPP